MLDGRIERELADGEAWCFWQQTKLPHQRSRLVEQEQGTVDIYEKALLHHVERSRTSPSKGLGITRETGSLSKILGLKPRPSRTALHRTR
jgi:hypothetical protein